MKIGETRYDDRNDNDKHRVDDDGHDDDMESR